MKSLHQAILVLLSIARSSLLIVTVTSALRGLLPGLQVAAIGNLITTIATHPGDSANSIYLPLSQLLIAIISSYLIDILLSYMGDKITLKLSFEVEINTVKKFRLLDVEDYENSATYDSIQRIKSDTGQHIYSLFDSTRSLMQSIISIAGVIVVISAWNPWIALLLLLAPIPATIATFNLQKKAYNISYARASKLRRAEYLRTLLTSDTTIKEIKLFNIGSIFEDNYTRLLSTFLCQDISLVKQNLTKTGTLGIISVLANGLAIALASLAAINGYKVGELAGFITASLQMNSFATSIFITMTGIHQHLLYVSNWVKFTNKTSLKTPDNYTIFSSQNNNLLPRTEIEIEFKNVSFSYPGTNNKVLDNVSFKIYLGSTTALVGKNGSGKSTICKLILRFYTPTSGVILLNGININCFSKEHIYKYFSGTFQDFTKFEFTVGDNVTFGAGKPYYADSDRKSVLSNLHFAELNSLEDDLPEGLNTFLGRHFRGGYQLSAGQWQRLAFARALYKNPKFLVLDEPTSSIDAQTENAIFGALNSAGANMTVLLVTHRFTTIQYADQIIVIDDGKIVGFGNHRSLLSECALYKDLLNSQAEN